MPGIQWLGTVQRKPRSWDYISSAIREGTAAYEAAKEKGLKERELDIQEKVAERYKRSLDIEEDTAIIDMFREEIKLASVPEDIPRILKEWAPLLDTTFVGKNFKERSGKTLTEYMSAATGELPLTPSFPDRYKKYKKPVTVSKEDIALLTPTQREEVYKLLPEEERKEAEEYVSKFGLTPEQIRQRKELGKYGKLGITGALGTMGLMGGGPIGGLAGIAAGTILSDPRSAVTNLSNLAKVISAYTRTFPVVTPGVRELWRQYLYGGSR